MIGKMVVEVEGLQKAYRSPMTRKKVEALKQVSFSIHAGVITGFLGANGAGKTTTIKCLLELAFADAGKVHFFGKLGLSNEAKSKIGFLPERPYFYDYLTGREFLKFYGQLSGRIARSEIDARAQALLQRVGLSHAGDRPLRGYSKGMLQRIGIAQALIHKPEFIILDEPMTGLDPDGRHEVREIIREVASQGTAVFFSSHHLSDAESLCERLVILKKGELVFEGRTDVLMNQVDTGWRISYINKGSDKIEQMTGNTFDGLQREIDLLRAAGNYIREVGTNKASLEEVFIKMAFDPKADQQPEVGR
jgi:ABC-2 type transport system ATP-binding protein